MVLKEDLKEAKERMAAWWEGEYDERPVISYSVAKQGVTRIPPCDHWWHARPENFGKFDEFVDMYIANAECYDYKCEQIPRLNVNYGPGVMASVLGCEYNFNTATVWFVDYGKPEDLIDRLESAKMNDNNEWYKRILQNTEIAAQKSNGEFSVGITDLGGIMDIIASFLSFKDLILTMTRKPGIIDTARAIVIDKWHKMYDAITNILHKYDLGTTGWLNVWSPKNYYPIQCDVCAALSPKLFKRFILPDMKEQCDRLDHVIYHWDGPKQLKYADDILAIPNLDGIQWVPGSGEPEMGHDKWMPVYKKIQKAGKFVQMGTSNHMGKVYRELDPKKLIVDAGFGWSHIIADFYLPEFLGGMGGIDPEEDDH